MNFLPILLKDFYKSGHVFQYAPRTRRIYANMTGRGTRVAGVDATVPYGLQYCNLEYLQRQFTEQFFQKPREEVLRWYKRRMDNALGVGAVPVKHIGELHEVGYLPIRIKAIQEGTLLPLRVPMFTIVNTQDPFYWLTNMLETLMSCVVWLGTTSATTAYHYRLAFERYARETGADPAFVKWQGHDFSFRGMGGVEAAVISGSAHLLSFTGTDTIPAIDFLEGYYGANSDVEMVGGSVPATEHSVMSMGQQAGEHDTIHRLLTEVYPTGPVSVVSDTWDFWNVVAHTLPDLREVIMARDGKLIVRPDSGDPVKIICGDPDAPEFSYAWYGAIALLWTTFGGSINEKGYKVLDPHVGLIYGDSITRERQEAILGGLKANGFASSNVVLGIGSYTYQHVTRDTYGLATKATYGETGRTSRELFKAPKTDDGTKRSACGLLRVERIRGRLTLTEHCSWEEEQLGELRTVFEDGHLVVRESLAGIRARVDSQIAQALAVPEAVQA